jgi:hypothetical protein
VTWNWIWPCTGPAPTSDEPDAEIFDTERVPLAHSFVREAVQNSLDAAPPGAKVSMRFSFGEEAGESAIEIFAKLREFRKVSGHDWPEDRPFRWIVVEDFGTTGLKGGLSERTGDFWNYWLNFGISNKSGSGRGGRGVGRKTFLLVSAVKAVIGSTRRSDGTAAVSGYAMLRPGMHDGRMRAGLAIFAAAEYNDVYNLHPAQASAAAVAHAFSATDRGKKGNDGFSLIVPYPDAGLTAEKIRAALIENFAPAIMGRLLAIEVDGQTLDDTTIASAAAQNAIYFSDQSFRERYAAILALLYSARQKPDREIRVDDPGSQKRLREFIGDSAAAELRNVLQEKKVLVLTLHIPVLQKSGSEDCPVKIALSEAPSGKPPIDEFYRAGMRLPNVVSKSPGGIDVVILADEGSLVTYLNLCEGKAHLDLLENEEVRKKLKERGFEGGTAVKRCIKRLPDDIREIVLPDATKPDSYLFARFFAAQPRPGDGPKPKKKKRKSIAPPDPPPPKPSILRTVKVERGFEVRVEPDRADKLVEAKIIIKVAYASGSRKLDWQSLDFNVANEPIKIEHEGCDIERQLGNEVRCVNCRKNFFVRVTGFDPKREVETDVTIVRAKREDA